SCASRSASTPLVARFFATARAKSAEPAAVARAKAAVWARVVGVGVGELGAGSESVIGRSVWVYRSRGRPNFTESASRCQRNIRSVALFSTLHRGEDRQRPN